MNIEKEKNKKLEKEIIDLKNKNTEQKNEINKLKKIINNLTIEINKLKTENNETKILNTYQIVNQNNPIEINKFLELINQ